jgi:heme A synthase
LIIGIVYWLVMYVIDAIPIPDPPARFVKIAATVLLVLFILNIILGMIGVSTGIDVPKVTAQ